MTIPNTLTTINERADAVFTAFQAGMPQRVVQRSFYQNIKHHAEPDIRQGVVMLLGDGESDYTNNVALRAQYGVYHCLLVAHLKVSIDDERNNNRVAIQNLEGTLIEEIKTVCRAGIAGLSLHLIRTQQSRQLLFPFGYVYAEINAVPPQHSLTK